MTTIFWMESIINRKISNNSHILHQQEIILKLTRSLLAGDDLDSFLAQALPLAAEALAADHLHLWQSPTAVAPLTCDFVVGTAPQTNKLPDSLAQEIVTRQRPLALTELLPTQTKTDWLPHPSIPYGLLVPIPTTQRHRQILCFYSNQPPSQPESDLLLVQQIADLFALADKQSHTQAVQQTLNIREQAIASSLTPFAISDLNGSLTYVNDAFVQLWEYEKADDALGQSISSFWMHPEEEANFITHLHQHRQWHGELLATSQNGTPRKVAISASLVVDSEGTPLAITASFRDVTEQRQQQKALQESQARLQAIVDNSQDAILIVDDNGRYIESNPAGVELFGYTTDELQHLTIRDITGIASQPNFPQIWERFMTDGKIIGLYEIVNRDGQPIEVEYNAVANFLPGFHLSFLRDVTEKRQRQSSLQESQARLQAVFNHSQDGILIANNEGQYIEANPAALNLLGYNSITALQQSDFFTYVPKAAQETISGRYALIRKDGRELEIEYWVVPNFLPNLHLHFLRDITLQQQQQLAQQKLTNALDQTDDVVIITNKQGVIEYVNTAFTTISGYTLEEALGQTLSLVNSGHHDLRFYRQLWQKLLAGQTVRRTFINRHKSGRRYYNSQTITPLLNEYGKITHFISSGRDITMQREASIALQESNAFNRAILDSLPAHIVVLDKNGAIITTNEAWQRFGRENGVNDPQHIINGVNYLEICRQATGPYSEGSLITYHGLTSVLSGQVTQFDQEYPCPSPKQERWFILRAVPLQDNSGRIIVTHTDITQTKLLQQQLETVYQFGQELVTLKSESEILQRFLQIVLDLFSTDLIACALIDETQQELVYDHFASLTGATCTTCRFSLTGNKNLGVATIQTGQNLYVADLNKEPFYETLSSGFSARSAYAVPIWAPERIIGVVTSESSHLDGFTNDDRRFLDVLTHQLGQALHNARLFAREQQQAQNLTLLYQASRTISSSLDLPQVLDTLLYEIKNLLSAKTASIILYDEEKDQLYFASIAGGDLDHLRKVTIWPDESIAGWALRQQKPILIEDVQQDPRFYRKIDKITGLTTRALMAVPLTANTRRLGVVEVLSEESGAFVPQQLQLLQSLSNNAAVAIENARLFSAERQLKEHLQRSQFQLVQSEKMGALGRLTASIAHEINNPLQSIQGFLTLISENLQPDNESPKVVRYLEILESEVERIAQLVKHMRDFYRPSQQEMEPVDIYQVLQSILALINKRLEQQAVTLQTTWDQDLPPVLSNPDHLKQVFLNLLLNALDAMPEGGQLHIQTSLATLEKGNETPPAIRIDFIDTGHGIDAEILPHLFEPFVTTKENGTGLGLSISYNIIETHGGTMMAESEVDKGTTISILLPLLM